MYERPTPCHVVYPQVETIAALLSGFDASTSQYFFLQAILAWQSGERLLAFSSDTVQAMGLDPREQEDVGYIFDTFMPEFLPAIFSSPTSQCIVMHCDDCHSEDSFVWPYTGGLVVPSDFDSSTTFGVRLGQEKDVDTRSAITSALKANEAAFLNAILMHPCGRAKLRFLVTFAVPNMLLVSTAVGWVDPENGREAVEGEAFPLSTAGVEATVHTGLLFPGVLLHGTEATFQLNMVSMRQSVSNSVSGHFVMSVRDTVGGG